MPSRLVDHRADRAAYRQLADIIRERIKSGDLAPGARVPGELSLSQEHDVSRRTVRDAMAILRAEGLIVTTAHRETRVREAMEVETVHLGPGDKLRVRMPSALECRELDIPEGTPLIIITRANGEEETHFGDRTEVEGSSGT